MESQSEFQLSSSQYALLRQRLRDLYDHIRHHPALHQRYLWVGKGKPDIDPDIGTHIVAERQVSIKKFNKICSNYVCSWFTEPCLSSNSE